MLLAIAGSTSPLAARIELGPREPGRFSRRYEVLQQGGSKKDGGAEQGRAGADGSFGRRATIASVERAGAAAQARGGPATSGER